MSKVYVIEGPRGLLAGLDFKTSKRSPLWDTCELFYGVIGDRTMRRPLCFDEMPKATAVAGTATQMSQYEFKVRQLVEAEVVQIGEDCQPKPRKKTRAKKA